MNEIARKLLARRSGDRARRAPTPKPAGPAAAQEIAAVCAACEADWGAMRSDEIAELLIQSGRFAEERREWLLAMPREQLVGVFCGCEAGARPAPSRRRFGGG